nr:shikimate kinase [Actinomyces polynesiensis]
MSDPEELGLPLVLVGMPGSGKSRVGRALAARLAVDHVDSDDLVVEEAGMEIPEIFSSRGRRRSGTSRSPPCVGPWDDARSSPWAGVR